MMPNMNIEEIKHLASLSRIRIEDEEAGRLKTDIDAVLEYVSVVSDIAAEGDLTKKVGARYNVFRQDEMTNEPGSYSKAIMDEAPAREGDLLKVKTILSQD